MAQKFKAKTLISNSGVFNNEVIAPNLVYNTSNQTISGNKSFVNKIVFANENGTGGYISGSQYPGDGDSSLFINAYGAGAQYIYLTAGPSSMWLGEGGVNINNGNNPLGFDGSDDIYINGTRSLSANNITASFQNISSQTGIFNAIDLSNIDILTLSGVDITIISGVVALTNRPTVNGTGILLSGEAATLPTTIVYTTGNQTISGIKSFATGIDIINSGNPQSLRVFNKTGTNTGEFGIFGWSSNQLIIGSQSTNSGIFRDVILTGNNININASGALIINNTNPVGGNNFVIKDTAGNNSLYYNPTQNGNAGALFSNYIYSSNIGSRNNDDWLLMYGGGGTKSVKFYGYDGSVQTTRAMIDSNGNFGIGSGISSVPSRFYVTGDSIFQGNSTVNGSGIFSLSGAFASGLPNNPLSIVGSGNTYLQLNIQNRATGTNASADLVITANNGTDSSNFINLGINNSGYNDPLYNNATGYDGYLFIDGGDLDIGTRTAGKIIEFHAGGTTESKVIARISETGLNIVSGTLNISGSYNVYTQIENSKKLALAYAIAL
jgi:hypothetical protein